jgi:hypothetical protein
MRHFGRCGKSMKFQSPEARDCPQSVQIEYNQ